MDDCRPPEWALPKIMAHTGKDLRGCPHLLLENQCLGTGTKRCCVQILSTWYVTVYIITVFIRLTALGAY